MAAKAEVHYDPAQVSPSEIASSITELGFPSSVLDEGVGQGEVDLEVSTCVMIGDLLGVLYTTVLQLLGFLFVS